MFEKEAEGRSEFGEDDEQGDTFKGQSLEGEEEGGDTSDDAQGREQRRAP
jgi:hypothetical protein